MVRSGSQIARDIELRRSFAAFVVADSLAVHVHVGGSAHPSEVQVDVLTVPRIRHGERTSVASDIVDIVRNVGRILREHVRYVGVDWQPEPLQFGVGGHGDRIPPFYAKIFPVEVGGASWYTVGKVETPGTVERLVEGRVFPAVVRQCLLHGRVVVESSRRLLSIDLKDFRVFPLRVVPLFGHVDRTFAFLGQTESR